MSINARYQTEFAYQQRGLLRRTVAQGLGGEWSSVTLWRSKKDVHAASAAAEGSPIAQQLEEFIDPATKRTEFFRELPG